MLEWEWIAELEPVPGLEPVFEPVPELEWELVAKPGLGSFPVLPMFGVTQDFEIR